MLVVGLTLAALGATDFLESRKPWYGEFRFEITEASREMVSFPATATFSGHPYVGIGNPFSARKQVSKELIMRVDRIEPTTIPGSIDTLTVSLYGEDETHELTPGASFSLNGERVAVLALRPFAGLLSDAQGVPMANVSLRTGDALWIENVMLMNERWRRLESGLALRLIWCTNESEAVHFADEGRPGLESARWGVRDRGRTHWFGTFVPGAGVELDDGTSVTLIGLEESDAGSSVLEVEVMKDGASDRRRIQANIAGPLIEFEYPGLIADLLLVYAWADDAALVAYLHETDTVQIAKLAGGESWTPSGSDLSVRLEQAMRTAVPVAAGQTTLYEVLLDLASVRVRVRQGEAVRVGDALLRYARRPAANPASYRVELSNGLGEESLFELAPGERREFQSAFGRFSLDYEDLKPESGIVIRPEDHYPPLRLGAGIIAILLAIAGLRYGRRGTR